MKKDLLKTLSRAHLDILRLCLITVGLMVWGNVAWAQTLTDEMNFRTVNDANGVPTGWNGTSTKYPVHASTDKTTMECTYRANMWVQQLYDVTNVDFDNTQKVVLTFHMSGSVSNLLGVWVYDGDTNWTTATNNKFDDDDVEGTTKNSVVEKFKEIVGVYPGVKPTEENPANDPIAVATVSNSVQTIVISGITKIKQLKDAVKTVTKDNETKKYLSFIITYNDLANTSTSGIDPKFHAMTATTESNRTTMTINNHFLPAKDILYRINDNNDGWNATSFPNSTSQEYENKWSSRFVSIQQYEIPDFKKSTKITLKLQTVSTSLKGGLAVWNYKYANDETNIPTKNATSCSTLVSNVTTITGIAPGTTKDAESTDLASFPNSSLGTASCTDSYWTFEINTSAITPIGFKDDGTTAIVNFLITSSAPNNATAGKYTSINYSGKEPYVDITYGTDEYVAYNSTKKIYYTDLSSALTDTEFADASSNAITLLGNVTLAARIIPTIPFTLTADKDLSTTPSIKRGDKFDGGIALCFNNTSKDATIEGIILDGNNVETKKISDSNTNHYAFLAVEQKSVTLKDLTVKNINQKTKGYCLSVNNNSSAVLSMDNVTFDNCVANDGGVVYVDGTSGNIELRNNIEYSNITGNLFLLKHYVKNYGVTNTTPIPLTWYTDAADGNLKTGETVVSNQAGNWSTYLDKFVLTNSGYHFDYNSSNGDFKTATAPTFTMTSTYPYASYCLDYNAQVPSDLKAYIMTGISDNKIYFKNINGSIPKNTGVILYNFGGLSDDKTYTLQTAYDGNLGTVTGNQLKGTTAENTSFSPGTGKYAYVVSKFMQNGQLVIMKDGKKYNAAGQLIK